MVSATLLAEMVALQRATASGINIDQIPKSSESVTTFVSSTRDIWINSLWITSLVLTLATALVAGMVQQWLNYYVSGIAGGSAKNRACTRRYRFTGLTYWNVPAIIEALPVLMNTSLFLFFVGLILFTRDLSGTGTLTWVLIGLTLALFALYVGSSFMPILFPHCPYKTSLSRVYVGFLWIGCLIVRQLSRIVDSSIPAGRSRHEAVVEKHTRTLAGLKTIFVSIIKVGRKLIHTLVVSIANQLGQMLFFAQHPRQSTSKALHKLSDFLFHIASLRRREGGEVKKNFIRLQQNVVAELALGWANPSVQPIALQALAGYHIFEQEQLSVPAPLTKLLRNQFEDYFRAVSFSKCELKSGKSATLERYARAVSLIPSCHDTLDFQRVASFAVPPTTLNEAVLFVSYGVEGWHLVMEFVLAQDAIDTSSIHSWHYHQLLRAINMFSPGQISYFVEKWKDKIVSKLVKLSPREMLSLQESLLLRILHRYAYASANEPDNPSTRNNVLSKASDLVSTTIYS